MKKTAGAVVAVLLLVAAAGWWQGRQEDNRPRQTTQAAPMVAVAVPELTGLARQGADVFEENCAACHGANGAGNEGYGPPLLHPIYRPNHHADGSFFVAVQNGVRAHHWTFGDMPPVAGLSQSDILKIVTYIRELQRRNGVF